jgi:hypothetical protein
MSTYVLIHGAFHGGRCWHKVVTELEKRGHAVLAPILPRNGAVGADVAVVADCASAGYDLGGKMQKRSAYIYRMPARSGIDAGEAMATFPTIWPRQP